MKYFSHSPTSREDDRLWQVIDRHGLVGYGAWWVIVEELYKAIHDCCRINLTPVRLKRLNRELGVQDESMLLGLIDTFAEVGLISAHLWEQRIIFSDEIRANVEACKNRESAGYRKHELFVFERDGGRCVYCKSLSSLTLDHVIPRSRGGSDDPSNLVTCCKSCNSSKGARTPEEWRGTAI